DAGRARRNQEADRVQDGRLTMTPFLQTAGWALIHYVWEGVAITAVTATVLRLLERRSANARYIVACTGLVAMLAAPAMTARLMWTGRSAVMITALPDATAEPAGVATGDAPFHLLPKKWQPADARPHIERSATRQADGGLRRDWVPAIAIAW